MTSTVYGHVPNKCTLDSKALLHSWHCKFVPIPKTIHSFFSKQLFLKANQRVKELFGVAMCQIALTRSGGAAMRHIECQIVEKETLPDWPAQVNFIMTTNTDLCHQLAQLLNLNAKYYETYVSDLQD